MATVLQMVDASTGAVLFDFNDQTGANNPSGVRTILGEEGPFSLGAGEPEQVVLSPASADGGFVVSNRVGLALATWRQFIQGPSGSTSPDALIAGVGELGRLLGLGGRIKYVANNSSAVRYIDFEPSVAPAIYEGQPYELRSLTEVFAKSEGVLLQILRQPFLLEAEADPTVQLLTNPTLLYDFGGTAGRPDDWTWTDVTGLSAESIDATDRAYKFTKANAGPHNLEETTASGTFAPGDVAVLSFYARVVAVAGTPRARARVEFLTAAGASVGGAQDGTLTTLTTAWQRLSVTSAAAGATTSKVRVSLITNNADGTSVVVEWRYAQLQKTSLTGFRVGRETISPDPASATKPRRMMVFADGDAPANAEVRVVADAANLQRVTIYRESFDPVTYEKATLHKQGESGTLTNNTSSVADANASGGNAAETTFPALVPALVTDDATTGTGSTVTVAAPAGVVENDVVFVWFAYPSGGGNEGLVAAETGWVPLGSISNVAGAGNEAQGILAYKIAGPSEPASYQFKLRSSQEHRIYIGRVSNVDTDDPIDAVSFNGNPGTEDATGTITGVITTRDNALIVAGIAVCSTTPANVPNPISTPAGTTPTFTELDDGNTGDASSGGAIWVGTLATAGATGDKTVTFNDNTQYATFMVAFNPSPGPLLQRIRSTWAGIPAGTYDVLARVYPTASAKVRLHTEWAIEGSPSATNEMRDYILDATDWTSYAYVLVNLGRLSIPDEWPVNTLTVDLSLGLEEFSVSNFRVDWLDLAPANEFRTSLETLSLVGSTETIVGDGDLPKVFHLDSAGSLRSLGKAGGPIPLELAPGPNLLTIYLEQGPAGNENFASLVAAPTVAVYPTPAHRT